MIRTTLAIVLLLVTGQAMAQDLKDPKPAPMADDSDQCKAAFALPPSGARTMAVMRHCKVQPPR